VAVAATPEDVDALAIPRGSAVGVVCQTTLSADVVQKVMEALRARYPVLETGAGAGVCTATRDRQDAVRRFVASGGDGVLVLGSETSSNTRRLVEIARGAGAAAWRAVDAAEVAKLDFKGVRRLGVTSGASTPEDVFADVMANFQIRA
jgi:4-hydroxy-3-methylbut-2-enyl diphosphate reductase